MNKTLSTLQAVTLVLATCANLLLTSATSASSEPNGLRTQISELLPADTKAPVSKTEQVRNYELLISAAEKVGRELRADEVVRVSGERTRTLWMLPQGADLESTFEVVGQLLSGEELFRCAGRDCGRSTAWANLVYNEALVVGQDRFQRYRAVRQSESELQSIYLVRRGNRRVHLLLETIQLETTLSDAALAAGGRSAALALANHGLADLAVKPGLNGEFDAQQLDQLRLIGFQFAGLTGGDLYVVCHLYGNTATDVLLEQSSSCAEEALGALQEGYSEGATTSPSAPQSNRARPLDTRFLSFGAGPLLPRLRRDNGITNRLELVLPNQLQRP